MIALVLGPTGTAGSAVLQQCLAHPLFSRVIVLHRRSTGIAHEKLHEQIHSDFTDYSGITALLEQVDVCFFCLGISQQKEKDKERFFRITHDYPIALATALKQANPDVTFCFLSGQGADRSGKSNIPFARAKGAAENALIDLGLKRLFIFRPGYIHTDTPHAGRIFGERVMGFFYPVLKKLTPGLVIHADELAKGMVKVGLEGHEMQLLGNTMIKQMAESS